MAKNVYYLVEANDGVIVSQKCKTLAEARKELKSIIKEDKEEFELDEGDIDYHIVKYIETDDTIYYEEVK